MARPRSRAPGSGDVASAYEHSGYSPDEITLLYPDLTLADIHRALAFYYEHIDEFRETMGDDETEATA